MRTPCGRPLARSSRRDSSRPMASPDCARSSRRPAAFLRFTIGARTFAGRWTALRRGRPGNREAAVETFARTLLRRYGVVFRRILARESSAVPWRDLTRVYRRLEARGEMRGGRFVSGMSGEQFALPEAVERLREMRRTPADRHGPHHQRRRSAEPRRHHHQPASASAPPRGRASPIATACPSRSETATSLASSCRSIPRSRTTWPSRLRPARLSPSR